MSSSEFASDQREICLDNLGCLVLEQKLSTMITENGAKGFRALANTVAPVAVMASTVASPVPDHMPVRMTTLMLILPTGFLVFDHLHGARAPFVERGVET